MLQIQCQISQFTADGSSSRLPWLCPRRPLCITGRRACTCSRRISIDHILSPPPSVLQYASLCLRNNEVLNNPSKDNIQSGYIFETFIIDSGQENKSPFLCKVFDLCLAKDMNPLSLLACAPPQNFPRLQRRDLKLGNKSNGTISTISVLRIWLWGSLLIQCLPKND